MKVGLIARCEDRGLGIQTWEWYRHMQPDRTLLVHLDSRARHGFEGHPARFPGALNVEFRDGQLPEAPVRAFLDGLDVVYSAETFYDWRLCAWARRAGCGTACHVNPEFFKHDLEDRAHPTAWWAPTSWRLDALPAGTRQVPVPIPLDRWPEPSSDVGTPLRWLHVIGRAAHGDRNGTQHVIRAMARSRREHKVTVRAQERIPSYGRWRSGLDVTVEGATDNYWMGYAGHDVLLMPRRYGGLCLPALEAMGAGLAVLMPDTSPQSRDWPTVISSPTGRGRPLELPCGMVDTYNVDTRELARLMDSCAADPSTVMRWKRRSREWAEHNSWDALRPTIVAELERAIP